MVYGSKPLGYCLENFTNRAAVRELGMSGTSVGNLLSLGQPAVSRAVVRGEKLAQDLKLILVE